MSYGIILIKFISSNNEIQIWTAIFLAIFTFFALIPFLLDMLDLMKPSTIIDYLERDINDYEMLYSIHKGDADGTQPIIDIIHSAIMNHDHATLRKGLDSISKYKWRVNKNVRIFKSEKIKIFEQISKHLVRMTKVAINLNDDETTNVLLLHLDSYLNYYASEKIEYKLFELLVDIENILKLIIKNDLNINLAIIITLVQPIKLNSKLVIDKINSIYDILEENIVDEPYLIQIQVCRELLNMDLEKENKKD